MLMRTYNLSLRVRIQEEESETPASAEQQELSHDVLALFLPCHGFACLSPHRSRVAVLPFYTPSLQGPFIAPKDDGPAAPEYTSEGQGGLPSDCQIAYELRSPVAKTDFCERGGAFARAIVRKLTEHFFHEATICTYKKTQLRYPSGVIARLLTRDRAGDSKLCGLRRSIDESRVGLRLGTARRDESCALLQVYTASLRTAASSPAWQAPGSIIVRASCHAIPHHLRTEGAPTEWKPVAQRTRVVLVPNALSLRPRSAFTVNLAFCIPMDFKSPFPTMSMIEEVDDPE
ncbi:hypothetical protein EVG20_g9054, partial [Dentipellis fragilis]